jgi:hypothetical protein
MIAFRRPWFLFSLRAGFLFSLRSWFLFSLRSWESWMAAWKSGRSSSAPPAR